MPTLSVCCIKYKHENFLTPVIESTLMQKTDFSVGVVIGEDCTTDSTRHIALDVQRRYPSCIRILLPETKIGVMGNLLSSLEPCKGTRIALLKGDYYWSIPNKLQ